MADSDKKEKLSLGGEKKDPPVLGLKSSREGGAAKSGSRNRGVQVEVRRKRSFAKSSAAASDAPAAKEKAKAPAKSKAPAKRAASKPPAASQDAGTLNTAEKELRARVLAEAAQREEEREQQEAEERKRREAEDAARRAKLEENARRQAEEKALMERDSAAAAEEKRRREEQEKREREEREERESRTTEAEKKSKAQSQDAPAAAVAGADARLPGKALSDLDETRRDRAKPVSRSRGEPRRRDRRLTVEEALTAGENERSRSIAAMKRHRARQKAKVAIDPPVKVYRDVVIPDFITVADLANRMSERAVDVIKFLMKNGIMATQAQTIDAETAELVVSEFGHRPQRVSESDVEIGLGAHEDAAEELKPRPPVVTVMGHVDHGKTSLLDALREADVVSGEAGGITQHIGAYQVETQMGNKITFIDTPGHAAFTSMRQRGAKVTDIVILVVAADDGVMPQTVEAINHSKAAEVPIIVAINKIDKPGCDPSRVKQELLQHEVISEDFGGDVQMVEISALQKINLDGLEEAIMLQAEMLELKANPDRPAEGLVVEAQLDKGRGPVATVLMQRGTLHAGEIFVVGNEYGRARALNDSHGQQIEEAGPSVPVEILGLNGTPNAGDDFFVVESEAKAREISEYRQRKERIAKSAGSGPTSLEQMFSKIKEGEIKELPVVVKTDVQGSMEAIVAAAEGLANDEVKVRILHAGVGGITESDVALASASGAVVFGFNVRANTQARDLAKREGTDIFYYSIIYELMDQLKSMLSGMLAPQINEIVIGGAEVLEVFNISKVGRIAGCRMTEGVARPNTHARLLRDDVVIHDGPLASLKRFKEDAREVHAGQECGIGFETFQDIKAGDRFEIYEREEVERTL